MRRQALFFVFSFDFFNLACFDDNLAREEKFHDVNHKIQVLELALLANGLPAHCDNKYSLFFL